MDGYLAISPDGRHLAVNLHPRPHQRTQTPGWGAVWLKDLVSGRSRLINYGPSPERGGARCVAFSPDSKVLALCEGSWIGGPWVYPRGADYAVQLWDVATGEELPGLMPGRGPRPKWVTSAAFSPDGSILAAATPWTGWPIDPLLYFPGNLLHLWDRRTGEELKLSTSYHGSVLGLAFSPDGTRLAVANSKHISLLDVREREEVYRFECHAHCYGPSFSADGRYVASGDRRRRLHVWDVETGKDRSPTRAARLFSVDRAIFSPADDVLAALGEDSVLHFWDVSSGREIRSLAFPQGVPYLFLFTPDGKALISGGPEPNPVLHMCDAQTGKELERWDLAPVLNGESP